MTLDTWKSRRAITIPLILLVVSGCTDYVNHAQWSGLEADGLDIDQVESRKLRKSLRRDTKMFHRGSYYDVKPQ